MITKTDKSVKSVKNTESPPAAAALNPRQILTAEQLQQLNRRSNRAGAVYFAGHLLVLATSGYLWATAPWGIAIPAVLVYGVSLAFMFCAMHECVHRTAFASSRVNDAVAWFAGLLSFYNATFYRPYHKWHHRYTQILGKDPELDDPKPQTRLQYLWRLTGLPWWAGKLVSHGRVALGWLEGYDFLPAASGAVWSTRAQLGVYGAIALATTLLGHPLALFTYWVLPLAMGQPVLRFVLLAEHGGCTGDSNPLTNTRTTLTLWPLRRLMWNMPYHAEHHLYPSIPCHALPAAHSVLRSHFDRVDAGYLGVHRGFWANFKPVQS